MISSPDHGGILAFILQFETSFFLSGYIYTPFESVDAGLAKAHC
jgi:hypothetical protein